MLNNPLFLGASFCTPSLILTTIQDIFHHVTPLLYQLSYSYFICVIVASSSPSILHSEENSKISSFFPFSLLNAAPG